MTSRRPHKDSAGLHRQAGSSTGRTKAGRTLPTVWFLAPGDTLQCTLGLSPVHSHEWLVAFHVGAGSIGRGIVYYSYAVGAGRDVDQCAKGEVTAKMQNNARDERPGGRGEGRGDFRLCRRGCLLCRRGVVSRVHALRCVAQFPPTNHLAGLAMETRRSASGTECVDKRPPRWPKNHQRPAWRGARRHEKHAARERWNGGSLFGWPEDAALPIGQRASRGAAGLRRSRLSRQSEPAGSFRAAHPHAVYAPVKRNGCALPLAGHRGISPYHPPSLD